MSRSEHLSLSELQSHFFDALRDPKSATSALLPHLVERAPVPTLTRLDVYQYAYLSRITEAVVEDFPKIRDAIGETDLEDLVREYLEIYPSRYPTLTEVGQHFEAFLRAHSISKTHAYLPEMAQFEWKKIETFYTDDLPAEDWTQKLSQPGVDLYSLRLEFQPHVSLMKSEWAFHQLSEKAPIPSLQQSFFLFYRENWVCEFESISHAQHRVLEALLASKTLGQALSVAQDPTEIQSWFSHWASRRLIRNIFHDS